MNRNDTECLWFPMSTIAVSDWTVDYTPEKMGCGVSIKFADKNQLDLKTNKPHGNKSLELDFELKPNIWGIPPSMTWSKFKFKSLQAQKNCNFKRKSSILCLKIFLPMEGFKNNCGVNFIHIQFWPGQRILILNKFSKQIWISSKKKSSPSFTAWFSILISSRHFIF